MPKPGDMTINKRGIASDFKKLITQGKYTDFKQGVLNWVL